MAAKWVRNKIELPEDLSSGQRQAIGKELLTYIRNRTAAGEGKGNKRFPSYSKAYIRSLDFKNAGKRSSRVNLKLSGDMMAALDVISHKKGELLYGFKNGTSENERAEGNVLGSYGGKPNPKKVRDFMGLTNQEIGIIIKLERGGILRKLKRGIIEGIDIATIPPQLLRFLVGEAIFEELVLRGRVGAQKDNGGNPSGNK